MIDARTIEVPGTSDSESAVEVFADRLLSEHGAVLREKVFAVRLGILEGARRAFRQAPVQGRLGLVRISVEPVGNSLRNLRIRILDPGAGFPLPSGSLPPYKVHPSRHRFNLGRLLRHELTASLESPLSLRFEVRLRPERKFLPAMESPDSLHTEIYSMCDPVSLIMLCRTWSRVACTHDAEKGSELTLEGPRSIPREIRSLIKT